MANHEPIEWQTEGIYIAASSCISPQSPTLSQDPRLHTANPKHQHHSHYTTMESHDIEYGCKMIGGRHTFSYSSFMQWANDAYALSSAREKEEGLWHFELYHGNEWLDIHGIGPIREFQMSIRRIPTRSAVQAAILHKDITGDRPRWKRYIFPHNPNGACY